MEFINRLLPSYDALWVAFIVALIGHSIVWALANLNTQLKRIADAHEQKEEDRKAFDQKIVDVIRSQHKESPFQ